MTVRRHPTPLSGGDRKALQKELGRARAMTSILAAQSAEARAKGEALIKQANRLLCESWNERMWADGGPIDPSPTVDQAINGGYRWIDIDLAVLPTRPSSTIWRADFAAASAPRPIADPLPRCYSWRSALARPLRRPDDVQSVFDHH